MTREEAIKGLKVLAKDFSGYKPNEEMFDMAIKALEQPECEDAVSRFKVLRLIDYSSHDLNDSVDNRYMQNEIKQLPSVTPKQPGWIPCETELPSEYDTYLITTEDGMVVFGVYDPKEEQWSRYDSIKSWWLYGIKVLAWQPLPKPWEGEGHE